MLRRGGYAGSPGESNAAREPDGACESNTAPWCHGGYPSTVILAAAVCPHPPLLVPDVAPGASEELVSLRAACDAAVRTLVAGMPSRVVVLGCDDVGSGDPAVDADETAGGTLAGYGADVRAGGGRTILPLSLTIGAWLLDRAGWAGSRTYSTGTPDVSDDVAVLVMADGTNSRSLQAPGFLDDRADAYDASISAALATGDGAALAVLDPELGTQLGATGVPALRTLGRLTLEETAKGARIAAQLHVDEAPFGVGYFVANWVMSRETRL